MKINYEDMLGKDIYSAMFKKYKAKIASTSGRLDKLGNPIEMRLTFDEWLGIWVDSGKIGGMGVRLDSYVMSRKDDIGHYEVGNVFIATNLDNIIEGAGGLSEYDRNLNEICRRTGYKRSIVKRLISSGKILVEDDGSVEVLVGKN